MADVSISPEPLAVPESGPSVLRRLAQRKLALLGLLIIGTLNNGLVLLNVSSFWQTVAQGALLIFAVSFDQLRIRLTSK